MTACRLVLWLWIRLCLCGYGSEIGSDGMHYVPHIKHKTRSKQVVVGAARQQKQQKNGTDRDWLDVQSSNRAAISLLTFLQVTNIALLLAKHKQKVAETSHLLNCICLPVDLGPQGPAGANTRLLKSPYNPGFGNKITATCCHSGYLLFCMFNFLISFFFMYFRKIKSINARLCLYPVPLACRLPT